MAGDIDLLLCEEPVGWAITRGTTEGESKFIPMTPTDLRMRVSAGRAMMAYVAATKRFDLFAGVNLNLNFPSVVGTVRVGDRDIEYGYSSGIYTKHVSKFTPIRSVPAQEEIDAARRRDHPAPSGTPASSWPSRNARNENVTLVGGVCQTALEFGRYLRRRHGVYPKELWKTQIMTLGSTPGINTRHAAQLTALYGPVAIREIYGATEGMFGQQRDERRAWVPNYDLFFFEVLTRHGHQDAARDEARRDGQPGGLDPHPGPLPHRRHHPGADAALLPLHRPRDRLVDPAATTGGTSSGASTGGDSVDYRAGQGDVVELSAGGSEAS